LTESHKSDELWGRLVLVRRLATTAVVGQGAAYVDDLMAADAVTVLILSCVPLDLAVGWQQLG
jgi:hypothetical protein